MTAIREHVDETLVWTQPRVLKRAYELRAGRVVLGSLRWAKAFSPLATAECSGTQWTFERHGFLSPRVSVRARGSGSDVAVLQRNWRGRGIVQVIGGRTYHWSKTSLWRSSWAFASDSGELLLRFSATCKLMRHHAQVSAEPRAASNVDL